MSDFKKCIKLIKYGKNARFGFIFGAVMTAIGLIAVVITLAGVVMSGEPVSRDVMISKVFYPAYLLNFGLMMTYQPLSSLFFTESFNASPLRRYAQVKFIPTMQLICGLIATVLIAVPGAICASLCPAAGAAAAYMMVIGACFFGLIITLNMVYTKFVAFYFIFIILCCCCFGMFRAERLSDMFMITEGTDAVLTGIAASVVLWSVMSLLQRLINSALYKKPFPKFWTKLSA